MKMKGRGPDYIRIMLSGTLNGETAFKVWARWWAG